MIESNTVKSFDRLLELQQYVKDNTNTVRFLSVQKGFLNQNTGLTSYFVQMEYNVSESPILNKLYEKWWHEDNPPVIKTNWITKIKNILK